MAKFREEKVYVYIALFFGLLFVFLTPPFQSPDEDSHFTKSYLISKGVIYPTSKKGNAGNSIPTEMNDYISKKLNYIGDRDKKYTFSEMVADQYDTMDYDNKVFKNYSTSQVLPVVYIAPSVGILCSKVVANIFDMKAVSTSFMLYFARLFSLILSIFIIYHAIKITPVFKKTMLAIASIPMVVYLSSMVTYDNILTSLSLLGIAIILKLIYDKQVKTVNWKYLSILCIIGFVLLNVKTVYSIIFVLMFFIPKSKFGDMKGKIKKFFIMIGIVLLLSIIFKIPNLLLKVNNSTSSLSSKQLSFVLSHPFKYLGILWYNIVNQRNFQLVSMIGLFGLIDTYMPIMVVASYFAYLICIGLSEGVTNKYKINGKMKIIIAVSVILVIAAIYTLMYVIWTPALSKDLVGSDCISGVQGRYFIPLLFPLILLFSSKKIKNRKIFKIIENNYLIIPIISLTISICLIMLRFWI